MDMTAEMLGHFSAFSPSNTAVYHVTAGGELETLYLSENIPSLLELTREEYLKITERDAMDLALPRDRDGLAAATIRCIRTGEPFDYHYRVYHKTKGFEWVHVYAHTCGTLDGRPLILALFSNMTAEGGIYQQLLDASDRKVLVIDRDNFELLYANENARLSDAGKKESLLNETCHSLLYGLDQPCGRCVLNLPQKEGFSEQTRYDAGRGRWEQITRRPITWCGRSALLVYIKDITAERTSELDVERFRQMYADATQEARLIVWTYDVQTKCVEMLWDGYTKEVCQKLGIPRKIGRVPDSLLPYVSGQDRAAFLEMYQAIDRGELRSECEFHFQVPGQDHPECERAVARVIFNEDGHRLGVYCFGQNITAQKQEEAKYQMACAELEQAHPYSLGSFRLNLTRDWCGNGRSPYPYILEQQKSGTVDGYFRAFSALIADTEIREAFFRKFSRASLLEGFSKGIDKVSIQYPALTSAGERRWYDGLLFLMRNPKTGDVEGVTYAVDISRQKRSEFILEKLIRENFEYIGIIRAKERIFELVSSNPADRLGTPGESINYDSAREYVGSQFTNEEELGYFKSVTSIEHILPLLRKSGSCSETYTMTANGQTRCLRLFFSWLEQPGGDILIIRSDITDSYAQEQRRLARMHDALLAADRANEEKSAFLSTMSHDLRTPLNGVLGFTNFALEEQDPEKKQEYLQKIKYSGELLLSLVNDTLELSRIESGKLTLTPEVFLTREIGQSVIESLRPVAEAKGVRLIADMPPEEYVYADRLKLQKIWINLLSNAIKYTPAGGTVRASAAVLDPPVNGRNRRLVVEDNGIGMSEAFMARMFEPFSQENRPEAGSAGGTGLGLAIVKRLVELLGGTISVRSSLGQGTRFEIELPVHTVGAARSSGPPAAAQSRNLSGRRVLLCEDNLLNREIASTLLKSRGVETDCAENGQRGLQLFASSENGRYSAILMDLRMPVMDGCEAAKAIRALPRPDAAAISIIAMTADIFEESIQAARTAGMNAYLTKPIIAEQLFSALSEAFEPHADT